MPITPQKCNPIINQQLSQAIDNYAAACNRAETSAGVQDDSVLREKNLSLQKTADAVLKSVCETYGFDLTKAKTMAKKRQPPLSR